jgi:BirA family biotin operon repressor/biotin-[acetyl-CoA-carboxylase] ligase
MPGPDDHILARLRAGTWISGAVLAHDLGVSRAAVHQRIAALRRAGFAVAAAPRRGYQLHAEPDRLLPEVVLPRLTTVRLGRALRHELACGSTNDEAAAWARAGAPEGATVVAESQHAGRGRAGRSWFSPAGENLYCSIVLRPPIPPVAVPPLTLAVGVAVYEGIRGLGFDPDLKWPNDVLIAGKKVAGILTEMSADLSQVHHVITGIGINVNTTRFPRELEARATSLRLARGAGAPPMDRVALLAAVLVALEQWYDRFLTDGAAAVCRAFGARSRQLGHEVRVQTGSEVLVGTARGVDDDGALVVVLRDRRTVRVLAGEILLWD